MNNRSVLSVLGAFALSSLLVALAGLILGMVLGGALVAGSVNGLKESFDLGSLIIALPIVTLGFGAAAFVTGNRTLWAYPIAAFAVSAVLSGSTVVALLAGYMPASSLAGHPQHAVYVATVLLSYVVVHAVVWPVRGLILAREEPGETGPTLRTGNAISLVIVAGVALFVIANSSSWLDSQTRAMAGVRAPDTATLQSTVGVTQSLFVKSGAKTTEVASLESNATVNWWIRDTHEQCGDAVRLSEDSDQTTVNVFAKSPGGLNYATATVPKATGGNEYVTCALIGHRRYYLTRKVPGDGSKSAATVGTGELLDQLAAAPLVIPDCAGQENLRPGCTSTDVARAAELQSRSRVTAAALVDDYTTLKPENAAEREKLPNYRAARWFRIPGWGIEFPLTKDLKNLRASPPEDDQDDSKLMLRSATLGPESCVAFKDVLEVSLDPGPKYSIHSVILKEQCSSAKAHKRRVELNRQIEWANQHIRKIR
jgi:hypothetical protein